MTAAVKQQIETAERKFERIVFEYSNPHNGCVTKYAFQGRFIVGTLKDPEIFSRQSWTVAQAEAGHLVVFQIDGGEICFFRLLKNFQDLRTPSKGWYPEKLIAAVAWALGYDYTVDLDKKALQWWK